MKSVNISKKRFESLEKINLTCLNTEATLYHFPQKSKWKLEDKIFKRFYVTSGRDFSNKMFTINSLIDSKDEIDIPELVIPDYLLSINSQIEGYVMEYVDGVNLSTIIYSSKISMYEKINYLKQLSILLDQMKWVRKYTSVNDFYLGDIHEDNIMIDKDGNIRIIDLDSCKIHNNISSPTRYLQSLKMKGIINQKYQLDPFNQDVITPSSQTDYYCLMVLLLNTLYMGNITKLDMKDFYNYLDFLKSIGFNKELIDCLSNIYTNKPNENIGDLLNSIDKEAYRANKHVFEYTRKK